MMGQLGTAQIADAAARFLRLLLEDDPRYPSVALFRCWELALLSKMDFTGPLLDLGCGNGRVVERLLGCPGGRQCPASVVGLDLNQESLRLAGPRPVYLGVAAADARTLPFRGDVVGSVVSICVLEHIPQVHLVFDGVARTLQPGGALVFSVPTPRFLDVAAQTHPAKPAYAEEFREQIDYCNVWEAGEWQAAVEHAGLVVRQIGGFMPPPAARVWFAANDWVMRPIRGRGWLYRMAGPQLRRFGLGRLLARYWYRRLGRAAAEGVTCPLEEACAVFIVAEKAAATPQAPVRSPG